ncbi:MAG: DUF3800 domain-containing protein [Actinomycetes bacterium]
MSTPAMRLLYMDDSGSEQSGFAVFGWIETAPHDWRLGLASWLDLRKKLWASYSIPPSAELHAAHLMGGRGQPSTDPAVNNSKSARRDVLLMSLEAMAQAPTLRIGTAYRDTGQRGRQFQLGKEDLYRRLVEYHDERFRKAGEYAQIYMDGDGDDPSYKRAHRGLDLATRHIIEDPHFQGSHLSQWVQMADLVAWTCYRGQLPSTSSQTGGRAQSASWYDDYLRNSDVNGGPLAL